MNNKVIKRIAVALCAVLFALVLASCAGEKAEGTIALGKTTITESELDTVMGRYTFDGESHDITIREVIEEFTTIESALGDDGTGNVPSTDDVLSYVRNHIILDEAAARGITVTDADIEA